MRRFTQPDADIDSFIESIVVLHGERVEAEQNQIPPYYWPSTGPWRMRGKSEDREMVKFYWLTLAN